MGGSPDLVAGVYIGYDQPRNLGGYVQGGNTAAPIWRQAMEPVLDKMPKRPFVAPAGMRMVRIDRRSGRRVYGAWPTDEPKAAVIWEAFKPETEPRRTIRREEIVIRQGNEDRSEEHTSELQSLMRISYAVFCLKKNIDQQPTPRTQQQNQ